MVSIPEKTLEHWASIYITYRYQSKADLWWPVDGEDIRVDRLPTRSGWGKLFQLELKSGSPSGDSHKVTIDLEQLDDYTKEPVPTYYVVPRFPWPGVITNPRARAWLTALRTYPAELAFSRSGAPWFADWTYVIPATTLRAALDPAIAPSPGTSRLLYTFDTTTQALTIGPAFRASGLTADDFIPWRSFWGLMETCGSSDFPAVFFVPRSSLGQTVSRDDLVAALQQAKAARGASEQLRYPEVPAATTIYVPDPTDPGSGEYIVRNPGDSTDTEKSTARRRESHLLGLFLGLEALF